MKILPHLGFDISDLDVDFNKAVMEGGGVAQQQRSSVFLWLAEKGVEEAGNTDKPESLPTACRQGEVTLCDPA